MLFLRKPGIETIRGFLVRQSKLDFTYSAVGCHVRQSSPPGYAIRSLAHQLGEGESAYEAAKRGAKELGSVRLGWLEAGPEGTPIQTNAMVAILARTFGIWWLNACRIVLVIEEVGNGESIRLRLMNFTGPRRNRRGAISSWNGIKRTTESWFDILAFSRPHHILTRLAYPIVRMTQKRFGRNPAADCGNPFERKVQTRELEFWADSIVFNHKKTALGFADAVHLTRSRLFRQNHGVDHMNHALEVAISV